ncbi:conserved hypothetical protein [Stigmatella aurantiaca DW4/3-1]|uniref:Uncharacterized protein n=1 Tax=Stigmatella aurantiaca (strain DW4/3-1) TaxID=378806 RepID=Q095U1_STIAD|nr:conserved hypothetical protein [Stigmatella aurantiaca DW4/3-1]
MSPGPGGFRVGKKPLTVSKCSHILREPSRRLTVHPLPSGPPVEIEHGQPRVGMPQPRGGQHMVGARHVVPEGHGGTLPEKDGAAVPHPCQVLLGGCGGKEQMLGREGRHEGPRLFQGVHAQNGAPLSQGGGDNLPPPRPGRRALHRLGHRIGLGLPDRQRHATGVRIVLGLGQHLAGHGFGIRRAIRHDEDLTGPRGSIDGHRVHHLELGGGDIGVAGTHDAIHPGHTLGAIGHGGHGPRPAQGEDPVRSRQQRRRQHPGRGQPIGPRRRADDDLPHPGHLRRHNPHQHTAGVHGPAARRINPHPPQRVRPPAHDDARLRLHLDGLGLLGPVGRGDVAGGPLQGTPDLRLQRGEGLLPPRPGHLERREPGPVELKRHLQQRGIAVLAHTGDELAGPLGDLGIRRSRALEQAAPGLGGQTGERPPVLQRSSAHGINLSMRVTRMPSHPSAFRPLMVR